MTNSNDTDAYSKDLADLLKKYQDEIKKYSNTFLPSQPNNGCPNCGYCPHCGRSNGYYQRPWITYTNGSGTL